MRGGDELFSNIKSLVPNNTIVKKVSNIKRLKADIQKHKNEYLCFDFTFILEVFPQLDDIRPLFENVNVVLAEEIIHNLTALKDQNDLSARYAFNVLDRITQIGNVIIIPKTGAAIQFKQYLFELRLSYKNPLHHWLAYYSKYQSTYKEQQLLLFTNKTEAANVAKQSGLHVIVYTK